MYINQMSDKLEQMDIAQSYEDQVELIRTNLKADITKGQFKGDVLAAALDLLEGLADSLHNACLHKLATTEWNAERTAQPDTMMVEYDYYRERNKELQLEAMGA